MTILTPLLMLVALGPAVDCSYADETAKSPVVTPEEVDALMTRVKPNDSFPPQEVLQDSRGAELLVAALERDPNGPWARYLVIWFGSNQLKARMLAPEKRKTIFARALVSLKKARVVVGAAERKAPGEQDRHALLELEKSINIASIEADVDFEDVKKSAESMLARNTDRKSWNFGNVVFQANTILGRVALREGRLNDAKQHLIRSGKTPGSPQLNSFGPDFVLAGELLQVGERQVVLEFLDLVAQFWADPDRELAPHLRDLKALHRRQLNKWKKEIERGQIPDFLHWRATSEAKLLNWADRPTEKLDVEFPSSDGFAMRVKGDVVWTLNDEQKQRLFWLVERRVLHCGARKSMAEMTSKQSHAKFISTLRDDVIMHMKTRGIQIDMCRVQVCVTHLNDDLIKRYRLQVANGVLLLK